MEKRTGIAAQTGAGIADAWQGRQASGERESEQGINEQLTDTQKVYQPAADLAKQFQAQFMALQSALTSGDMGAADQARINIANIEAEQRQAAIVMRQHLLKRVRA